MWSSVEPSPSKSPAAHAKRCSLTEAAGPGNDRLSRLGLVVVIGLTNHDEVVLTEQFRRPVNARVIDWPAGLIGDEDGSGA